MNSLTHAENANTQNNTTPIPFKKNKNHDANPPDELCFDRCDAVGLAALTGGAPYVLFVYIWFVVTETILRAGTAMSSREIDGRMREAYSCASETSPVSAEKPR
jgi:hypothetical protein